LTGCGGGGGAGPGASTQTAAAARYSVNMSISPSASVFYGGVDSSVTVSLVNNCASTNTATSSTTSDINKVVVTTCPPDLESVSGKVVTLTAS
ncbi:hypothetical protein ABTG19_18845, partial [Acinetobacter baumannii]